jgi:CRP/FNR family cyclic AMP-dependent transcriptional regulator
MGLNYGVINRDEGDSMYIVAFRKVKADQHLTLTELSAGAVFGEMALIDNSTRSMSVSTLTECQMGVLSRDFCDVMKNYPDIFKYLISTLSNRLGIKMKFCLINIVNEKMN